MFLYLSSIVYLRVYVRFDLCVMNSYSRFSPMPVFEWGCVCVLCVCECVCVWCVFVLSVRVCACLCVSVRVTRMLSLVSRASRFRAKVCLAVSLSCLVVCLFVVVCSVVVFFHFLSIDVSF